MQDYCLYVQFKKTRWPLYWCCKTKKKYSSFVKIDHEKWLIYNPELHQKSTIFQVHRALNGRIGATMGSTEPTWHAYQTQP